MSTRISPYVNNSLFISQFLSCFVKRNISMGAWEHIKLGELPQHNSRRRNIFMGTWEHIKLGELPQHNGLQRNISMGTWELIKLGELPRHNGLQRNISMGTWEHINLGELPGHNGLGLFGWGRSLKIHSEIKRELFTRKQNLQPSTYLLTQSLALWSKNSPNVQGGNLTFIAPEFLGNVLQLTNYVH